MKKFIVFVIGLSLFNAAHATNPPDDVKTITQKLKGEYKFQHGETVTLTTEQTAKLLKGETVKLNDKSEIQLTKEQLDNKDKLTTEDISNLLKGNGRIKKANKSP